MNGEKMKISTAMQKLHEAYKKEGSSLGCVDRATILNYIMKNNGLNPERRLFFFKDEKGNKLMPHHCVVIVDGNVYDPNIEESQNPIRLKNYEELKKMENHNTNLCWLDWKDADKNNPIDFMWDYLSKFEEEFQKEVKSLMKEDYERYMEKNPQLKK